MINPSSPLQASEPLLAPYGHLQFIPLAAKVWQAKASSSTQGPAPVATMPSSVKPAPALHTHIT
jgi:hypothetical protein